MYWWNKYLCLLQFWNLFETGIVVINPKCSDKIILSKFQSWKLSWSSREKPWTRTTRCGRIFSLVKLSKAGSRYVFLSLFTLSLLVFLVSNPSALLYSFFVLVNLSLSLSLSLSSTFCGLVGFIQWVSEYPPFEYCKHFKWSVYVLWPKYWTNHSNTRAVHNTKTRWCPFVLYPIQKVTTI